MPINSINRTELAFPLINGDTVEGWYKFTDGYLKPQVIYASVPPATTICLGGRYIEVERAVPVKIRLLEPEEDYSDWICKKQHAEKLNMGDFHRDFGDVEVAYSFTSPQTHIWFAGYAVHFDCLESLTISSYNATVNIRAEHILPTTCLPEVARREIERKSLTDAAAGKDANINRSENPDDLKPRLRQNSNTEVLPFYSTAVPFSMESLGERWRIEYTTTPQHLNDCERDIRKVENYDTGCSVSQYAHPSSYPPIYPPVKPFELNNYIQQPPDALPFLKYAVPNVFSSRSHLKMLESDPRGHQKMLENAPRKLRAKTHRSNATSKKSDTSSEVVLPPYTQIKGLNFNTSVAPSTIYSTDFSAQRSGLAPQSTSHERVRELKPVYLPM